MKVILLKTVKKLGEAGKVTEVTSGYARNFLFPQGFAKPATDEAVRAIETEQKRLQARAEKELKQAQKIASCLDGQEVEIKARASTQGKLFAAIKAEDIARAINQTCDLNLPPTAVKIGRHIKETGEVPVKVEIDHGLEAVITVRVVADTVAG